MNGFFESQPSSHIPRSEVTPWDTDRVEGPYEGEYQDAAYVAAHKQAQEQVDDSDTQQKAQLFDNVVAARRNLQSTGAWLVGEAIDDGEPTRDILSHPDYIEAQNRLLEAQSELAAFTTGQVVER
jgi:hypothetical protein